uniref:(northern house mosquito) hypothetical protein n=1 Tax=Culex pipiens TaxID=7175 RepID=A0A8D8C2I7_CULPI
MLVRGTTHELVFLFCFRETIRFELLATHTHRGKDTDSCIRPLLSLRKSFVFVWFCFALLKIPLQLQQQCLARDSSPLAVVVVVTTTTGDAYCVTFHRLLVWV